MTLVIKKGFHGEDCRCCRVYVITEAGAVDMYSIDADKHVTSLGKVSTTKDAKTGLFVPSQNLLYVGIPGSSGTSAQIRVYSTNRSVAR